MEKYDLSKITKDQLCDLLSTAKDEMVKYTNCREKVEWCEKSIEDRYQKKKFANNQKKWCLIMVFMGIICCILGRIDNGSGSDDLQLICFWTGCVCAIFFAVPFFISANNKKNAQSKITEYEAKLPYLQKEETKAFDKFFAVIEPYEFPRKYWYKYALTKMYEYVEDREASDWERVTDLYKRHLHELTMEENAKKTFEEMRKQTEIAIQTRNAARWTAAGVWTVALRR